MTSVFFLFVLSLSIQHFLTSVVYKRLCSWNGGVFVLQFNISKTINIIVCVETVQRACCRRLLVYTAISAVCVCLEPCDRTQVSDNGVSFSSSFLFIQPLARFLSLLCPAAVFVQLGLLSIQNVRSNTDLYPFHKHTLQYAGVFTFPAQHCRQHNTPDTDKKL